MSAQRGAERIDLRWCQHPGQSARRTDQRDPAPAPPSARPAGRQAGRHRVAVHSRVLPHAQVRVQAAHARQPPGDGSRRQTRLTVLDPHHPFTPAGRALGGQELKHIGDRHLRRRLRYHPEKDLQIRRHRQPRVGPGPCAHEDEVLVKQRVAQSDGPKVAAFVGADKAGYEGQQAPLGGGARMLTGANYGLVDHPCINHITPEMTMYYAQTLDATAKAEFLRYQKLTGTGQPAGMTGQDLYELMALETRTDRVLPNGWCSLPPAKTCEKGNACLTCDLFVTDRRFRDVHQSEWVNLGHLIQRRQQEHRERTGQDMTAEHVWLQQRHREQAALENILAAIDAQDESGPPAALQGPGVAARVEADQQPGRAAG